MLTRFFNFQTKTTIAAAALLGVTMFGSRLLGLARDRILAGKFGAGDELDMYYAAFQIPDFLYAVLIMGAISTAFLPVFTEYFHRDEEEAWKLSNEILTLFLVALISLGILLAAAAPFLVKGIAPGFSGEKYETTVWLTRVMFLSPVLFGISNILGVILQFFRRFLIYSIAPLLYNLGIIIGALFFTPLWGVYGLAYGVVLGAFLHMAVQVPVAWWCGFRFRPVSSFFSKGVLRVLSLMVPRSLGLAAYQLNLIVFTALASFISSGAIAVFNLANNLQYIPVGILGISFAVAAFPAMSSAYVKGDTMGFIREVSRSFRAILFFILPVALLFLLLRAHIIRVILGTGEFGWVDMRLTAASLGAFAPGIVFLALIPLLTRVFYARQNTKTPVIVHTTGVAIAIAAALSLMRLLERDSMTQRILFGLFDIEGLPGAEIIALPLAISLSSLMTFATLALLLRREFGSLLPLRTFPIGRIGAVTLSMGVVVYGVLYATRTIFNLDTFVGTFAQGAIAGGAGLAWYIGAARLLKIEEARLVQTLIKRGLSENTHDAIHR